MTSKANFMEGSGPYQEVMNVWYAEGRVKPKPQMEDYFTYVTYDPDSSSARPISDRDVEAIDISEDSGSEGISFEEDNFPDESGDNFTEYPNFPRRSPDVKGRQLPNDKLKIKPEQKLAPEEQEALEDYDALTPEDKQRLAFTELLGIDGTEPRIRTQEKDRIIVQKVQALYDQIQKGKLQLDNVNSLSSDKERAKEMKKILSKHAARFLTAKTSTAQQVLSCFGIFLAIVSIIGIVIYMRRIDKKANALVKEAVAHYHLKHYSQEYSESVNFLKAAKQAHSKKRVFLDSSPLPSYQLSPQLAVEVIRGDALKGNDPIIVVPGSRDHRKKPGGFAEKVIKESANPENYFGAAEQFQRNHKDGKDRDRGYQVVESGVKRSVWSMAPDWMKADPVPLMDPEDTIAYEDTVGGTERYVIWGVGPNLANPQEVKTFREGGPEESHIYAQNPRPSVRIGQTYTAVLNRALERITPLDSEMQALLGEMARSQLTPDQDGAICIALPIFSAGIYGYSPEKSLPHIFKAIEKFKETLASDPKYAGLKIKIKIYEMDLKRADVLFGAFGQFIEDQSDEFETDIDNFERPLIDEDSELESNFNKEKNLNRNRLSDSTNLQESMTAFNATLQRLFQEEKKRIADEQHKVLKEMDQRSAD
jgi:hypothetical protein